MVFFIMSLKASMVPLGSLQHSHATAGSAQHPALGRPPGPAADLQGGTQ